MDFVAIDFETANERRDSACAIGLTEVRDGIAKESIYHLIRPTEMRFSPWNTRVHGIRAEDVSDAPSLTELWPTIRHLVQERLIIAHNASFDLSVLRNSFHSASLKIPQVSYLCSLQLARRTWPNLASYSLGFLAEIHGLVLEHHHAGSDSQACAELTILAAKALGVDCPLRLADALNITVGEVFSSEDWIPSTAPKCQNNSEVIEITLPEGYDLSRHPFYQKSVVFTGTLTMFRREDAVRIVDLFGGKSSPTVTSVTNYLVVGVQDIRQMANGSGESSKMKKARQLQEKGSSIQIISDADFNELIFHPCGE